MDTSTESLSLLVCRPLIWSCRQTFVAINRDGSVCRQGTNREFGSAQFVDKPFGAVDNYGRSNTMPHKETAISLCDVVDPVGKKSFSSYALVFDAIYNPKVTRLMHEAGECGAALVGGVEMFLRQAMGQFELFTNSPAPAELMREIALKIT